MAEQESLTTAQTAPATRAFMVRIYEDGKAALLRQRPWSELLDRNSLSRPESLADATSRMRKNLSYFHMNYAVFATAVLATGLIWHPTSLAVLLMLAAAWFALHFSRTEPLVVFNRACSDREVVAALAIVSILLVLLTNTGSTLFTGVALAAAVVAIHASFRVPDDLFLDDAEVATNAYLSFQPNRV